MSQMEAQQPATTYAEFKHEILNEIARCLNMPFNIASGNSSGYNYASGRLDHQTYFKAIRVDQSHLGLRVKDGFATWPAIAFRQASAELAGEMDIVYSLKREWRTDRVELEILDFAPAAEGRPLEI